MGSRLVGGRIQDQDLGASTYTATVEVVNVAPSATFDRAGVGGRGQPDRVVADRPVRPVECGYGGRVRVRLRLW